MGSYWFLLLTLTRQDTLISSDSMIEALVWGKPFVASTCAAPSPDFLADVLLTLAGSEMRPFYNAAVRPAWITPMACQACSA